MPSMGIDPDELETCLAVLARLDELPVDDADAVAVRRATARIFKSVKERRRAERRAAVAAADRAVVATTATAAPGRVDDETSGVALVSIAAGATAGTLLRAPLLPVQVEVHAGRRVLSPVVPVLLSSEPSTSGGARGSERATGAADGRPSQDRYVHRASVVARWRADDHHNAVPERRGATIWLAPRQRRVA